MLQFYLTFCKSIYRIVQLSIVCYFLCFSFNYHWILVSLFVYQVSASIISTNQKLSEKRWIIFHNFLKHKSSFASLLGVFAVDVDFKRKYFDLSSNHFLWGFRILVYWNAHWRPTVHHIMKYLYESFKRLLLQYYWQSIFCGSNRAFPWTFFFDSVSSSSIFCTHCLVYANLFGCLNTSNLWFSLWVVAFSSKDF